MKPNEAQTRNLTRKSAGRRTVRRRTLVALLLATALCLGIWAHASLSAGGSPREGEQTSSLLNATVASTPTSTSTTSTTSTTVATVPMSKAGIKEEASAWAEQIVADPELATCRLAIPVIELDVSVLEMTEDSLLDIGPGHWPETPLPGQGGHFVISGHRTLCGGPFLRLGELEAGDEILVDLPYGEVRYKVTQTLIVGWEDTHVVRSRGLEELSLTTCHPIGKADSVMVVQAEAVDFRPIEG